MERIIKEKIIKPVEKVVNFVVRSESVGVLMSGGKVAAFTGSSLYGASILQAKISALNDSWLLKETYKTQSKNDEKTGTGWTALRSAIEIADIISIPTPYYQVPADISACLYFNRYLCC
jgi:hypothetical protein